MSNPSSAELAVIESKLKGKTLLVYWHLLKSPSSRVGVRQIQRFLHFSSPSVAAHHLDKLLSLGLVDKSKTGACMHATPERWEATQRDSYQVSHKSTAAYEGVEIFAVGFILALAARFIIKRRAPYPRFPIRPG